MSPRPNLPGTYEEHDDSAAAYDDQVNEANDIDSFALMVMMRICC